MIILCADDYGLSAGVNRAICELAHARRLSATSAMVTFPEWRDDGPRLAALRDRIAIGVHLNLTAGAPAGEMPTVAPGGRLPGIGALSKRALARQLDRAEIEAEIVRQFRLFEDATGFQPDHVDGHQHVHALPVIRDAVVAAVRKMAWPMPPLLRASDDRVWRIVRRGVAVQKALTVTALTRGHRRVWRAAGLPTNDSFAGFSNFTPGTDFAAEMNASFTQAQARHLVMCHPGYPDDTLRARDSLVERREEERRALSEMIDLPSRIWHPSRGTGDPAIDWSKDQ